MLRAADETCSVNPRVIPFDFVRVRWRCSSLVNQAKLQEEPSDTPLQEKLDAMAALIGYIGMACAAATFVATMCVYFTTHRVSDSVTSIRPQIT